MSNFKKNLHSVSIKLSLKFSILLALSIVLVAATFSVLIKNTLETQKQDEVIKAADHISEKLLAEKINEISLPYYISYVIYDSEKNASGSDSIISTNDHFLPLLEPTEGSAKSYFIENYFTDGNLNILYSGKEITLPDGKKAVIITSENMDTDSISNILSEIPKISLYIFFPILIFSFFVSLLLTKRTMKPVIKMTESAKKISSSNLEERLPVSGNKDELDELAKTFNDLFSQLDKDFTRERQFTSDVSHELKTPVAVISGQANLLRRWGKNDPEQLEKSLNTIISETKSMNAIIQNLLQMSRLESGRVQPEMETVKLKEMFLKIKEEVFSIKPEAKILFDEGKEISITADSELLHQVFMVVISNSLKFCQEKPCEIKVEYTKSEKSAVISLEDNGPGFGDKNIEFVFERFFRGDEAHTRTAGGSGLGLSIAKTIIESMNGKISAFKGQSGGAGIKIELF